MANVKALLISGSAYVIDKSGGHKTEVYHITGIDPKRGDVQAQAAAAVGVPRYFQAHPSLPGIVATSLRFEPFKDSKTKVRGTIDYNTPEWTGAGGPDALLIRVDSTCQRTTTQFDEKGNLLVVNYQTPAGKLQPVQYPEYPDLEHGTIIEFQRDMTLAQFQTWSTYRRRLNSQPWQGGKKRTWACVACTGTTIDAKYKMRAALRFEWNENTWDSVAFWKDSVTGTQPKDIAQDFKESGKKMDDGNGWGRGVVIPAKDFRALNFPEILKAP